MWLFDQNAFTSTVAYSPKKDLDTSSTHRAVALASPDPEAWLLVRARVAADLAQLEAKLVAIGAATTIHIATDKSADYSFRALVSRDAMKAYLAYQVDHITYGSHFKEVAEKNSTQGHARHSAMMKVWSAMATLQPHAPYGGYSSGSYKATGKSQWSSKAATPLPTLQTFVPFDVSGTPEVDMAAMRHLLTKTPVSKVPPASVEAASDEAFELYLRATYYYAQDSTGIMTVAQVDELVDELNEDSTTVVTG